jgi:hypothetical protein
MKANIVEYMTTREAAAYLSVSRQWLEIGRSKAYGPPFMKVEGIVRYRRTEVDRSMLDHQRNTLKVED